MRTLDQRFLPSTACWRTLVLATACLVCACASSPAKRRGQIELHGESGFTITEQVRVSGKVRSDFEQALRLIEEKEYERGIELLRKVTEAAPDATTAHIDLAIAYRLAGDLERAESSIESALELNPRHPVAHNELGIVYRKTGRFEEARASYERALAVYPDFHFARRNLAILCDVYLTDPACALEHYGLYTQLAQGDEAVPIWIRDLQSRMER